MNKIDEGEFNSIQVIKPFLGINKEKPDSIKILFLGDMMLDRTIRTKGEISGYDYLFSCMKDIFNNHDLVVVNSEGSITNGPSVSQYAEILSPPSFRFTFYPDAVRVAKESGIDIFGIANNHIYDFHDEGVYQTQDVLNSLGIKFFGSPVDEEYRTLTISPFSKKEIVFIPFNEFYGSFDETISDIRANKDKMVIVFSHWGDEYVPASERVKRWAHSFIDEGADLVIGHHPHVIQESEMYKDKKIYYSLGNFIFDQYWEEAVRTGLAVSISIESSGEMEFEEYLLDIKKDGQTCPKKDYML